MPLKLFHALSLMIVLAGTFPGDAGAQPAAATGAAPGTQVDRNAAGDSPADPGPLATDLSSALTPEAVKAAMRKVANWQVSTGEPHYNQQWTYAALYDGLLAASRATGDPRFHDSVLHMAEGFRWQLIDDRFPHADDEAIGGAYLELYQENPAPERIAAVRTIMDRLIARKDDPAKNVWWWCDALFMAPPVLARLSEITGDRKYLDYMNHEWWLTSAALYDPAERLFFRDDRYLTRREANGKKLFWSRGNGWVLAGLAAVLTSMPADYPDRPRYVEQFRAMAARVKELQGSNGLWRSGLLDPGAYSSPEISGSDFFVYALAWGVNHGILPREGNEEAIRRGWQGTLRHIYQDGRLGSIQPIDAAPGAVKDSSSYVYGVGAFLLAGSEITKMHGIAEKPRK